MPAFPAHGTPWPALREQLTRMGLAVGAVGPAQLGERERAYTRVWAEIIRTKGFVPQ